MVANPDAWRIKFEIMSLFAIPKVMRIVLFQLISQLASCIQIIHVTVHKQNISSGLCVHTLPSPTIGTLQSYTCLLMPWLHSHPTHVAIYCKPCALVHISTCICILQSCTHMLRLPVVCICQSFTCVNNHVYHCQSIIPIYSIQYSILVWYRNHYQTLLMLHRIDDADSPDQNGHQLLPKSWMTCFQQFRFQILP